MSYPQQPNGEQQPYGPPSSYPQPGYGQAPYGQPMPGYWPAPVPPTNGMAIVALIMAFVFTPLGLVLGYIARGQIRRTGESGAGLATAAIVIGWIVIAVFVVLPLIALALAVVVRAPA